MTTNPTATPESDSAPNYNVGDIIEIKYSDLIPDEYFMLLHFHEVHEYTRLHTWDVLNLVTGAKETISLNWRDPLERRIA